eukprot:6639735-Pyramimonas_sp.AAC.1
MLTITHNWSPKQGFAGVIPQRMLAMLDTHNKVNPTAVLLPSDQKQQNNKASFWVQFSLENA